MYSVRHPARRYDREYIAYPISVFSLCVACLICRCGSVGKHGGFCFFSFPAVSMISCPHPPAPLPGGKGAFSFHMQGASPLASPRPSRKRHGLHLRCGCPAGGLPGRSATDLTFSFISFPHPPDPLPLRGRGSLKVYFAGGFAPGTPALNRLRHLQTLPYGNPAGGLPGRSAARPALNFIGCPHPPAPLPVGKGAFRFHMQGASPLASPRPSRKRHGLHLRCGCPAGGLARQVAGSPCLELYWLPPSPCPPSRREGGF